MVSNPTSNKIGAGVSERALLKAVTRSGFPTQTIVANQLRDSDFSVRDEWNYMDSETSKMRAIDILAEKRLHEKAKTSQVRIRPYLNLIIECKKSELPYVFFVLPKKIPVGMYFPQLAGLRTEEITAESDEDRSTHTFPILMGLGLTSHPFVRATIPYCSSFTKCVRKGTSDLELSGESFNDLVRPTLGAVEYLKKTEAPSETAQYFDCHLVVGLGVLDAPMISITVTKDSPELAYSPWFRLIRHETQEDVEWWHRNRLFAIDIVHKDFFQEYLIKEVMPFASEFASAALRHQQELATGKGFVQNISQHITELEKWLKPSRTSK